MKKNKKIIVFFFKIVVVILSYLYIINRLKGVDFNIVSISLDKSLILFFVLLLMVFNWSLEAKKWQFLVNKLQKITFFEALRNTLVGIVLGMFTPNRVGEIGGKAVYLRKKNKLKGAIAASLGSFAQMTITVIVGFLGFSMLLFFLKSFDIKNVEYLSVAFFALGIIMLFLFFNLKNLIKFLKILKLPDSFLSKLEVLSEFDKTKLLKVLFISFLRYLVFVLQFYLLLLFFGVEIDFFIAIAGIFTVFLLMNILPNLVIADLGIRGSVSMFVLGQFATNIQGILAASIFLWIINILIPAFFGQILLIKTKNTVFFK